MSRYILRLFSFFVVINQAKLKHTFTIIKGDDLSCLWTLTKGKGGREDLKLCMWVLIAALILEVAPENWHVKPNVFIFLCAFRGTSADTQKNASASPPPCQPCITSEVQSKILFLLEKFWSTGIVLLQQVKGAGPSPRQNLDWNIKKTHCGHSDAKWKDDHWIFQIWNIKSRFCHSLRYQDHWLPVVSEREAYSFFLL